LLRAGPLKRRAGLSPILSKQDRLYVTEKTPNSLYLLRHAKAQKAVPGEDDLARPLVRRGRDNAEQLAVWLKENKVAPATVLCSPSARTRETLEIIQPVLGDPEIVFEAALYGASPVALRSLLARLGRTKESALIVGHNPGIQELAVSLAGHGPPHLRTKMREKFPTCALAVFTAPVNDWTGFAAACRIEEFLRPADLDDD
jgi:phosphohistidine phosphatase